MICWAFPDCSCLRRLRKLVLLAGTFRDVGPRGLFPSRGSPRSMASKTEMSPGSNSSVRVDGGYRGFQPAIVRCRRARRQSAARFSCGPSSAGDVGKRMRGVQEIFRAGGHRCATWAQLVPGRESSHLPLIGLAPGSRTGGRRGNRARRDQARGGRPALYPHTSSLAPGGQADDYPRSFRRWPAHGAVVLGPADARAPVLVVGCIHGKDGRASRSLTPRSRSRPAALEHLDRPRSQPRWRRRPHASERPRRGPEPELPLRVAPLGAPGDRRYVGHARCQSRRAGSHRH